MKFISIFAAGLLLFCNACKKDTTIYGGSVTLAVVNATTGGPVIKVNPGASTNFYFSKTTETITNGAARLYNTYQGERVITVVNAADTTSKLFSGSFNLTMPVNTIYLAGTHPTVETVFKEETNIPFIDKNITVPDSSLYVRFANLSPASSPVNIKLQTGTGNEFSAVGYKNISDFKKYAAKSVSPNYVIEIRDAATNNLLTTYTLTTATNRFKTVMVILKGNIISTALVTYF